MQQGYSSKALKNILNIAQVFASNRCYNSCSELPLYNFIQVQVTNDLKYLVISGNPKDLISAWDSIISEYATLTNDPQQNFMLSCAKEITALTNKLFLIQSLVDCLSENHHKGLAAQLNSLGFRFKYDPTSPDYHKELKLTISQSKTLILRLEQRKRDLENLQTSKGVTEGDYESIISELSKFQGYPINKKQTTVSEYVAILKRFKESVNKSK